MQKVERQKHKDRGRKRFLGLVLCAVLLAAGVTAGILLRNKAAEEPEETYHHISGAISQRNAEELESLTVTQKGKDPWSHRQSARTLRPHRPSARCLDRDIRPGFRPA